jgi:hypothetical protein
MIDYIDFVAIGGVQYVSRPDTPALAPPTNQVGERVGVVQCRLADSDAAHDYQPRDGDAAFLAPGTAVYAVPGHVDVVAAMRDGRYVTYIATPGSR